MKKKDTILIIPALNEEQALPLVLHSLNTERLLEVVVVDNGSIDSTIKVAKEWGAQVLTEPIKGYGAACFKGVSYALDSEANYVAFIDADYSDYPQELQNLLEAMDKGYDLVIGGRYRGGAVAGLLPHAKFGNFLACSLMKFLLDSQSPFRDLGPMRVIQKEKLKELNMRDRGFGWTVEMQGKALLMGLSCKEVPVGYRARVGKSKISGTLKGSFLAGFIILRTLFSLILVRSTLKVQKGEQEVKRPS